MWQEEKHPRDSDGKFTDKSSETKKKEELENKYNSKMNGDDIVFNVNLEKEIQKQFDNSTPKERQKIAFKYIMDNLRGKYPMKDGRIVKIQKVGADKMSHSLLETKIRVLPELAELLKYSVLLGVVDAEHKKFKNFAYYKVKFRIKKNIYSAILNVGIRENGESTLYDINPIIKK